jgi:hypothetical protein
MSSAIKMNSTNLISSQSLFLWLVWVRKLTVILKQRQTRSKLYPRREINCILNTISMGVNVILAWYASHLINLQFQVGS